MESPTQPLIPVLVIEIYYFSIGILKSKQINGTFDIFGEQIFTWYKIYWWQWHRYLQYMKPQAVFETHSQTRLLYRIKSKAAI